MKTLRRSLVVAALAMLSAHPAIALDQDFPVDPGQLSMHTTPKGTKLRLRARRGSVAVVGDPTYLGASFQLFNSAGGSDDLCTFLPASNWSVRGYYLDEPNEFSYRDQRNEHGPVRKAHFGNVGHSGYGDLRFLLTGAGYSLDEPSQGSIAMNFRLFRPHNPGDPDHTRYCTDFVPPHVTIRTDTTGAFRATFNTPNQYAGPCPTPPSFCSPGSAFLDDPGD